MKGRWILAVIVIFMLLGTFPLSGAAKVDAGTKSVNVQTKATSGTSQLSDEGYPDVIEFHGIQNREQALLDIANGQYDLGMFSFPIETYLNLGSDISSNLSLYKSASSYNELTFNTYHDPDKDAPIVTNNTGIYFNPFAVREIRFALNYLISRDHIVQSIYHGGAAPMFGCIRPSHPANKYFEPVYNSLNLTGSGNVSYALALFDEGMSKAIQEVAKYNHTLQKINGTWYFDGEPVTVKFIIRIEDERGEIGDYVADLIEQYFGFKVDRLLWNRIQAGQVVFVKPPSNYEWNIYTGGWVAGGIPSVWIDDYTAWFYASWYGYVPGAVEPKHVNTVTVGDALKFIGGGDVNSGLAKINTEFYKDGNDLGPILNFTEEELTYLLAHFEINKGDAQNTQYLNPNVVPSDPIKITTKEQYWDLQKISMLLGVLESARIFLIETWEFYPANKQRVIRIVSENTTGIDNRWSIITAKTQDRHLRIANPAPSGDMFMSALNPIGIIYDRYLLRVWALIRDFGGATDFDGIYVPYRCNWSFEKGDFIVPNDAVIYNQTQGWISKNAGKHASVRVKVTCDIGMWHNNIKGSIDDIKNYIAFLYTWKYKDSPEDPYYDQELAWSGDFGKLGNILGFQWTNSGYVVYGTYEHPVADDITAKSYIFYPSMPWELYWAMGELVADGDAYGVSSNYSLSNSNQQLDLLNSSHVEDLKKILEYARDTGGFKNSLPGINLNELKDRAAADLAFTSTYGYPVISNGPYYLANYSPENLYIKLIKFTGAVPLKPLQSQTSLTLKSPLRAHPGGLTVLNVALNTTMAIGALQFNVTFDPASISVVNVSRGESLPSQALVEINTNNSAGVISVGIVDSDGISSNGTIISITLRVNASVGSTLTVSVIPVDASNPNGTVHMIILPCVSNIQVTPWGDINGDGRITAVDALLYLRAAIGLSTEPFKVDPLIDDITGDSRITVADALKALRMAVGLESI